MFTNFIIKIYTFLYEYSMDNNLQFRCCHKLHKYKQKCDVEFKNIIVCLINFIIPVNFTNTIAT